MTIDQILEEAIRKAVGLDSPIDFEIRSILNSVLALVYCNDTYGLEQIMSLAIKINLEKSEQEIEEAIKNVI